MATGRKVNAHFNNASVLDLGKKITATNINGTNVTTANLKVDTLLDVTDATVTIPSTVNWVVGHKQTTDATVTKLAELTGTVENDKMVSVKGSFHVHLGSGTNEGATGYGTIYILAKKLSTNDLVVVDSSATIIDKETGIPDFGSSFNSRVIADIDGGKLIVNVQGSTGITYNWHGSFEVFLTDLSGA